MISARATKISSYQNIKSFLDYLPNRPVLAALTATATSQVQDDILQQLSLENPYHFVTSFDRPNLYFAVEEPSSKFNRLLELLKSDESTIIYGSTRKEVEEVAHKLQNAGFEVDYYHGGMSDQAIKPRMISSLTERPSWWLPTPLVWVSTSLMFARSSTTAWQKVWRLIIRRLAVQDVMGNPLTAHFSTAGGDIMTNRRLLEMSGDGLALSKLDAMIDYARTATCLRRFLLAYFGEIAEQDCGDCSNCLQKVDLQDITTEALKILSCVYRMNERYGMTKVAVVLKGKNTADNRQFGFDRLSTYGLLSDLAETTIKKYISFLVADKFLRVESDYKVLKLTNKGRLELKERQPVLVKRIKESKQAQRASARTAESMDFDQELFEHLRQTRFELAQDQGVPPFIIFSDVSLKEMAAHQPTIVQEFLDIKGVGAQKLERYGEIFMTVIDDYIKTC